MAQITRLHLARMTVAGETSPVHGFVVAHAGGALLGDAVYTARQFSGPKVLPDGQASDRAAWDASLERIRSAGASRYHFCHDTAVLHS